MAHAAELTGFASLPADTFSQGPTSGQFVSSANGRELPLGKKQPVQGFSAVLPGRVAGTFDVMTDNGFGTKANSPDTLLRVYTVRPDFRTWDGTGHAGSGTVLPVEQRDGTERTSFFDKTVYATLSDPDSLLGFTIVADLTTYPYSGSGAGSADIPVAKSIQHQRKLTGADLDIESFRRDMNGHYWFGDEFGPFLVKTDQRGRVLRSAIPMPGVQSPDNPFLGSATPTLNRSSGFEGMAINAAGDTLYTLLEGTVVGDPERSLRIDRFDVESEQYTGDRWLYKLEDAGTNIGDMTAVNSHQFLVIERNGTQEPRFKKIFLIDIDQIDADGFVLKQEVVDLMNLADPHDLNQDGKTTFTFPFVTIEDVLPLDANTLLVINDNNYPGSSRDEGVPDPNEFLKITLETPLPLAAAPAR